MLHIATSILQNQGVGHAISQQHIASRSAAQLRKVYFIDGQYNGGNVDKKQKKQQQSTSQ